MLIRLPIAPTEKCASLKITAKGNFTFSLHDSLISAMMILIVCIHLNFALGYWHFTSTTTTNTAMTLNIFKLGMWGMWSLEIQSSSRILRIYLLITKDTFSLIYSLLGQHCLEKPTEGWCLRARVWRVSQLQAMLHLCTPAVLHWNRSLTYLRRGLSVSVPWKVTSPPLSPPLLQWFTEEGL